jgi:hercynylcysteine S-oxide lyase
MIRANVISFGYKNFKEEFLYTGTRDYIPFITISEALKFRNWIGDEKVYEYTYKLCNDASRMLINRWNTSSPVPFTMNGQMANVRLPCNTNEPKCYTWDLNVYNKMEEKGIWFAAFDYKGVRYLRISCQIYNTIEDYINFANLFDSLTKI